MKIELGKPIKQFKCNVEEYLIKNIVKCGLSLNDLYYHLYLKLNDRIHRNIKTQIDTQIWENLTE
jgi:hypothetical protein